ncbi:hypothetical protein GCM10023196_099190 [Actinoallomurus vinaceus]|uniref:Right handed beta helix domain-containing protein n=1 Tax=Actinoallomurus vinaceus TaxID=1080074 RepID=A0ABP8UVD1_9ACTN
MTVPCSGPSGGASGLATAVANANLAGHGTIRLAANCNYDFTTTAETGTRGSDALPIIRGNITIFGGPSTHIRRTGGTPFRLIEVAAGARLTVNGIFIEGGDAGVFPGGAILSARGTVVLESVTVRNSTADNGAGIANDSGSLFLLWTLVTGNTTRHANGFGGGGAGIYNDGRLETFNTRISFNTANTSGGGIYSEQGGTARLVHTTLNNNSARFNGGGLLNGVGGRSLLEATLVTANNAADGGGIFDNPGPGTVSLFGSLVTGNSPNNCRPVGAISGCS